MEMQHDNSALAQAVLDYLYKLGAEEAPSSNEEDAAMNSLHITPHDNAPAPTSGDDDRLAPVKPTKRVEDAARIVAVSFQNMLDRTRGRWEYRTFDDVILPDGSKRQDPNLTCAISGSLKEAFSKLAQLNASGAGVFVTINKTDGKGRKTANVIGVQALFADTDGADIEPLVVLKPHIAVESSPGKFHLYWRVGDCDTSQFKAMQKAIAEKYGTDPAVCDLPRVMRLPGFLHNKSKQHRVMFVPDYMDAKREPYSVQEVVEGLGLLPPASGDKANGKEGPSGQSAENGHNSLGQSLMLAGSAPPPIETMRTMLKHLAAKNYFERRKEPLTDVAGHIVKLGWIETGMALKLAYGEEGFDLWAITHIDEQAHNDAPKDWASFAAEARPGHVTIGSIIKAAADADFPFEKIEQSPSADPILSEECKNTFGRLAALSPIDYDRVRKAEAETLGIRVATLDEEVEKLGFAQDEDEWEEQGQGQRIRFPQIEPWPTPVDGMQLLDEIETAYKSYVVMPEEGASAVALWDVFAHCYQEFEHSPRLALQSPEPRCGKTSVLKVTQKLVPRALRADNVTAAALFRMIEAYSPTLLVDEANSFAKENEELRGIINSGHEKGGDIIRTVGDNFEPRAFKTWGAMMIAGIGGLAGTIEDRSIIVKLKRKRRDEKVERFRSNRCEHLDISARKIARWVQDNRGALHAADPAIPEELGDRAADNWRPLLAIADEAGGHWPERARKAAKALSGEGNAVSQSLRLKLLADIREIFAAREEAEISSSDLAEALCRLPDRPWNECNRGRQITPRRVADLLAAFSIYPHKLKTGARPNGYEQTQFEDAFERYLGGTSSSLC